jgi:hypothetical protein
MSSDIEMVRRIVGLEAEVERLRAERDEAIKSEEKTHLEATLAAIELERLRETASVPKPRPDREALGRIARDAWHATCFGIDGGIPKAKWEDCAPSTRELNCRIADAVVAALTPEPHSTPPDIEATARRIVEAFESFDGRERDNDDSDWIRARYHALADSGPFAIHEKRRQAKREFVARVLGETATASDGGTAP